MSKDFLQFTDTQMSAKEKIRTLGAENQNAHEYVVGAVNDRPYGFYIGVMQRKEKACPGGGRPLDVMLRLPG